MQAINILAIIAAVVANMVAGSIWYGPLFGKKWMMALGRKPEDGGTQEQMKKDMASSMVAMTVFSFITAFLLSILLYRYAGNFSQAITFAVMIWLGFLLPFKVNDVYFGSRNKSLLFYDGGWALLSILISTVIIHLWK